MSFFVKIMLKKDRNKKKTTEKERQRSIHNKY